MIVYDAEKWYGYHKLFSMSGSVLPRTFPRCVVSSLACLLIDYYDMIYFPRSPYAHQVFTFGLSFLVIMRTNLAYSRYWEGISEASIMHAKWMDAVTQVIAFDEMSQPPASDYGEKFRHQMLHLVSLLGAVSIMELQGEEAGGEDEDVPDNPLDILVEFEKSHVELLKNNPISNKSASVVPENAYLVDTDFDRRKYSVLPIIGTLSEATKDELNGCEHKVHCVMTRILRLIALRQCEGGLAVPPPILSRVYQEFSNGILGLTQAKKVADIPFPFPYAQIVQYLQFAFVVSCPFVVMSFVSEVGCAMIFTFLAVFCYVSLNEVASELEDPFGTDANDLPLHRLHMRFVHQLYELGTSEIPDEDLACLTKGKALREKRQGIVDKKKDTRSQRRGSSVDMMGGSHSAPAKHPVTAPKAVPLEPKQEPAPKPDPAPKQEPAPVQTTVVKSPPVPLNPVSLDSGEHAEMMSALAKRVNQQTLEGEGVYHAGQQSLDEVAKQLFAELDIDNNDSLSSDEVARLCDRLEIKYSVERFTKLMVKLNPNYNPEGNDTITLEMFLQFAKKSQQRRSKKLFKKAAVAAVASVPHGMGEPHARSEYSASVSLSPTDQSSPPGYTG